MSLEPSKMHCQLSKELKVNNITRNIKLLIYLYVILVTVFHLINSYKATNGNEYFALDFRIFYEAGNGNLDWATHINWKSDYPKKLITFLYASWKAIIFYWCRYFDFYTAYLIWVIISLICYFIFLNKYFNFATNSYELILLICFWYLHFNAVYQHVVNYGFNFTLIFYPLLITPIGCLVAGLIKEWALLFLLFHFYFSRKSIEKINIYFIFLLVSILWYKLNALIWRFL